MHSINKFDDVFWHNGLVLKPYHLYLSNNNLLQSLKTYMNLNTSNFWGIIDFEYDKKMLPNGIIKITKLCFVNNDYELIAFDKQDIDDNQPMFTVDFNKIDFENAEDGEYLYLCCSSKEDGSYSSSMQFKSIRKFNNESSTDPVSYIVSKRQIHILSKKEIYSSCTYFPILSIKKIKSVWTIQDYEPSSVFIKKDSKIYSQVIKIIEDASTICDLCYSRIKADSASNVFDQNTFLNKHMYSLLAGYITQLKNIDSNSIINPFNLYCILSSMFTSINASLSNKIVWPNTYDHNNMSGLIFYISSSIINLMANSLESNIIIRPIDKINNCTYSIKVDSNTIVDNKIYIQVSLNVSQNQQTVKDDINKLTIVSESMLNEVVGLRISGIERNVFWGISNITSMKVIDVENVFYISLDCSSKYFDSQSDIIITGSEVILSNYNFYIIINKSNEHVNSIN